MCFNYACSKGGLEDNLATQSVVAGMWSCAYSFGEVIGPSAGGILLQYYGFPIAATAVAMANLILVGVCIVYFSSFEDNDNREKRRKSKQVSGDLDLEGSWKTCVVNSESEINQKF